MSRIHLNHDEIEARIGNHNYFLDVCDAERESLDFPKLSHFRVFALVIAREEATGRLHCIPGTNNEPCDIAGAICAERSALCQCRFLINFKIEWLYITVDKIDPLSPGSLCRSYLLNFSDSKSVCVFSGTDRSKTKISRIVDFYPYPSIYLKLTTDESLAVGRRRASMLPELVPPSNSISIEPLRSGYQQALSNVNKTDKSHVHPMLYAAVLIWGDFVCVTCQLTAYEYGCSLDSISQLVVCMEQRNDLKDRVDVGVILQCDKFGILHAPTAQARALLCEFGYLRNVLIGVHVVEADDELLKLVYVRPSELLPQEAVFSI